MGRKKKSGYTRRETNFWGEEKEVHYSEDGEKVGETRFKDKLFRGRVQEHYDADGEKVGETRKGSDWLGRDRAEHFDADGERVGHSRDATNIWGDSIQRHYDKESGDEVGVSRRTDEIDLSRGLEHGLERRKEHRGRYFKARPGVAAEEGKGGERSSVSSVSWGSGRTATGTGSGPSVLVQFIGYMALLVFLGWFLGGSFHGLGALLSKAAIKVSQSVPATDAQHVYLADIGLGGIRELAPGMMPTWSPDGTKVTFKQHSALYDRVVLMDLETGDVARIPDSTARVSWSPDSSKFVTGQGPDELIIVSAEGEVLKKIRPPNVEGGANPSSATFSPNGKHIAFAVGGGRQDWYVYVMDSEGNGIRRLTAGEWFAWSPGGIYLAVYCPQEGKLVAVSPDGREVIELTEAGTPVWDFVWCPDSFVVYYSGGDTIEVAGIVDRMRGLVVHNTAHPGKNVAWHPDGTWYVYTREDQVYIRSIVSGSGRRERAIPETEERSYYRWSPDGERLAFTANGSVYVIDALKWLYGDEEESCAVRVSEGDDFAWSPDSLRLLIVERE